MKVHKTPTRQMRELTKPDKWVPQLTCRLCKREFATHMSMHNHANKTRHF